MKPKFSQILMRCRQLWRRHATWNAKKRSVMGLCAMNERNRALNITGGHDGSHLCSGISMMLGPRRWGNNFVPNSSLYGVWFVYSGSSLLCGSPSLRPLLLGGLHILWCRGTDLFDMCRLEIFSTFHRGVVQPRRCQCRNRLKKM